MDWFVFYEERLDWRHEGDEEQPDVISLLLLPEAMVMSRPVQPIKVHDWVYGPAAAGDRGPVSIAIAHVNTNGHVDVPGLVCILGPHLSPGQSRKVGSAGVRMGLLSWPSTSQLRSGKGTGEMVQPLSGCITLENRPSSWTGGS